MPRIVTKRKRGGSPEVKADAAIKAVAIAVCVACAVIAAMRFTRKPSGIDGGGAGAGADSASGGSGTAAAVARPQAADVGGADSADASGEFGAESLASAADGGSARKAEAGGAAGKTASKPEPKPPVSGAIKEKEYFDNEVENTLASVSEPGAEFFGFPSIPDFDEDEIIAFLKRPVEIYDDDDEAAIAVKERTAEFKAKALEAIEKDGLTFNQFVRDIVALRNEQSAMREDARSELVKIFKAEGIDAANEYLEKVNPELKAQGLKEIAIPQWLIDNPDLL